MNITSRGARRTLAATCSIAVVTAGAALTAAPAFAVVPLTLSPSVTEASILNLDPTQGAAAVENANAAASFVLRTTDASASHAQRLQVVSGPTGGTLLAAELSAITANPNGEDFDAAADGANSADYVARDAIVVPTTSTEQSAALTTPNDYVALLSTTPGDYVLRLYSDVVADGNYSAADDIAAPTFTLHVKDAAGTNATASLNWVPSVTAPASTSLGQTVVATIGTGGLSTSDARGVSSGVGRLGSAIAAKMTVDFDQVANGGFGNGAATAPDFDGTAFSSTSPATTWNGGGSAPTSVTTTVAGMAAASVKTTTVESNGITAVALDSVDVTGSALEAAAAVAVKSGVATVTYKATATVTAPKAGKSVYFTLDPAVNSVNLTADGTLVSSVSGTKVYTALTDADGVATLIVTSGTTTAGTIYTVDAASNNHAATQLTTTYADAAATSIDNTNSASSLLATPGTSVTLTGRLLDQFGGAYTPTGSAPVQVAVRIPAGGSTVGNAAFSGNSFSYTYTPASTPTAGTSTTWDFFYNGTINGTDSAVNWTSSEAVSSLTLTSPVAAASVTQQKALATPATGTAVSGLALNASNAGLPYKAVTLTGSEGVYFSTSQTPAAGSGDDLVTSLTVISNSSGAYSGYAFFTKAGTATITATAGTATKSVDVTVAQDSDPYQVVAIDAAVEPGGTAVITGRVKNGWGHPVSGAVVNLTLGSAIATLGGTSATTNADGVWSTTVTGASGADGEATLTATLNGQVANAAPHANWLANAGLTIPTGFYQDTATITVDPAINRTTVSAPASRAGAGGVRLTGHAKPGTSVEIFAKPAGTSIAFALVGVASADAAGNWSSSEYVSGATTFFAKTSVSTSSTVTVRVTSVSIPDPKNFKLGAKSLGSGKVAITAVGNGDYRSVVYVYQVSGKKLTKVATAKVDNRGVARATVKTSKGSKTYKVVYINGNKSASKTIKVKVK